MCSWNFKGRASRHVYTPYVWSATTSVISCDPAAALQVTVGCGAPGPCAVCRNPERANTESVPLGGKTGLGSFEPLVPLFLPTDQFAALFSMCFCLEALYLIYIVDSFSS